MNLPIVLTTIFMFVFGLGAVGQRQPTPPITIGLTLETNPPKASGAVSIRTVLSNNSKQSFDASACYCGPSGLDSLFTWEARANGQPTRKRPYPHPELATGQVILDRIVQPGGELSGSQEISRLYDMARPGTYKIKATLQLPMQMGGGIVKSNEITVTVTP